MRTWVSFLALSALVACGGEFSENHGSGGAGGGTPDASAGSAGSGGDIGSTVTSMSTSVTTTSGGGSNTTGPGTAGAAGAGTGGRGGSTGTGGAKLDSGRDATSDVGAPDGGVPCKVDSDCKLVNTCCLGCVAKAADFPVPPCNQGCPIVPCASEGIQGVRCFQGFCSLAPECDPRRAACDSLPPPCPAGEVASIRGSCWSGQCVKASACRTVKDCSVCDPQTTICGQNEALGVNEFRCVDVPPACANNRTCACAGPYVCVPPFSACTTDPSSHFFCSCPNC
jgi:hypothetical protein